MANKKIYTDPYTGHKTYDISGKQLPKDISNITDEQVANLISDISPLGGENTMLLMGTTSGKPHIDLYGDSISSKDGSRWRVNYFSLPTGIFTSDPVIFYRTARQYDDKGNFIKEENRNFKYYYPEGSGTQAYNNSGSYYFNYNPNSEVFKNFDSHYDWFYNTKRKKQGGTLNYLDFFK